MTHEEKVEALLAQQLELDLKIIDLLKQQKHAPQSADRIELPSNDGETRIYRKHEIIMLAGEGQYTRVYLLKNNQYKEIMLCHNLGYWQKDFYDLGFLRLHNSYMVNPDFIIDFSGSSHYLELPFNLSFNVSPPYLPLIHFYFHNSRYGAGGSKSV